MDEDGWEHLRRGTVADFVKLLQNDPAYRDKAEEGLVGITRIAQNLERKVYRSSADKESYRRNLFDKEWKISRGSFDPGMSEAPEAASDPAVDDDVSGLLMPDPFVDADEFNYWRNRLIRSLAEGQGNFAAGGDVAAGVDGDVAAGVDGAGGAADAAVGGDGEQLQMEPQGEEQVEQDLP